MKSTNPLSQWIAYAVIIAMLAGNVSPAYAETNITINGNSTGSGNTWTSGSANTSYLHTTRSGDERNYTDWVVSPLNDTVNLTGGTLTTSNLYQNGPLYASGGNLNVSSGQLHIAGGSSIGSGTNLTLGSGATLVQTGGTVTINSDSDNINSGIISATGGKLEFTGGTHTITSGSNISNNLSITGGSVTFATANSLDTSLANSASVAFNGGTLDNSVSGTGSTTFNNTVTNSASVTQTTVTNTGALTNNGTITANLSNNSSKSIAGNGSIVTGTGTSTNNGTISQYRITNNGTFTSNGKITLTNGLTNNHIFNNNAMLLANVTNGSNSIFNSDPDDLGKDVTNDGTLNLNADGTLSVNVTGTTATTGTTNINGNLKNEGTISQYDVTVASGKVVTTSASDITASNKINNSGVIDYTGGSTANTITGTGRIVVTGYVTNTGNIDQTQVNNSSVFVNDGNVTANLVNTGSLEGTGNYTTKTGLSSNSGVIEQTNLTNNGTFDNNGHIDLTGTLTNDTNAVFNTDASLITADNGMVNKGTVNFLTGTNAVNMTDTGTTNFHNTTGNTASINQNLVTNDGKLNNTGTITANLTNTNEITGTGSIVTKEEGTSTNNGTIKQANLTNNGTFESNGKITVTSTLTNNKTFTNNAEIAGNVVNKSNAIFTNTADITGNVENQSNATFTNSADITGNVDNNGAFTNDGTITASTAVSNTGTFTNNGDVTGPFGNSGTVTNDGTITGAITNTGTGIINSVATNLVGTIDNTATLNIAGGEVQEDITGSTGVMNITADLVNAKNITQATVSNEGQLDNTGVITAAITNTGTINSTATNLVGTIDNANILNIAGGTVQGNITGSTGTMNITADLVNAKNITQATVNNEGQLDNTGIITASITNTDTGVINSVATKLNGAVDNNGTLNLDGGTTKAAITGTGDTNITADLTNAYAITQATVSNEGQLDNTGVITAAITNTGTINSTATNLVGTIKNTNTLNIAGGEVQGDITDDDTPTGTMNITADLVNAKNITQATVSNEGQLDNTGIITAAITNTNTGIINSVATKLNGAVDNNGTLNLNGGTTKAAITGTGDTNITADLTNAYAITQDTVTNNAVMINNATITATDIVNSGTIRGKASDLEASNGIANTGTLVFNADGTGASNISGTGNVEVSSTTTLTGTNTYTGGTQINGGGFLIVNNHNNLGTGDVSFTGISALQVKNADDSFSNNLRGVNATDNVVIMNDNALTVSGTIDNATDFYKGGAGAMTFAMASNGYTGDTHVAAGTLIGNTGNINNTVYGTSGTTVEFTDNTDAELNAINTAGTFLKSGVGTLDVKKDFTASVANINKGTFAVNNDIKADTLNIKSGATLRGIGSINDTAAANEAQVNVASGATIAPGNSIGTLTVNGDLNLASGSTTAIEINQDSSDKIAVTGTTNITDGANLTVTNEDGRFFEWTSFDILASNEGVNGTFNYDGTIANFDTDRIDVALEQTGSKVLLTAKRKATNYESTTAAQLSRNAGEAVRAVDAISTGFGGDITNALLQLEKLGGLDPDGVTLINPNATLSSALLDLTGVLYANSALIPLFNAKTLQVYDRIAQRSGTDKKCDDCANNVWVQYYNQHDKVFSSNNSPRFYNNTSGALVGYDRSLGDFLVGAYAGFGKNDLRQRDDSKMDVEDATFGAYGGYTMGDWSFKGTVFAGTQNYHGQRYISFMDRKADAKYNGSNVGLDLEASYNIPVFSWMNVKPFAGWLNSYAHQQAFTEKDAGALNLHVNSNDQFNSQARLGVRVDGQIKNRFSWYGSVAVKQFVGNDYAKLRMDLNLPNTDMKIISSELGRTSFGGQVGANYALTDNWNVFANVEGAINDKAANCYGNLGVAYTW